MEASAVPPLGKPGLARQRGYALLAVSVAIAGTGLYLAADRLDANRAKQRRARDAAIAMQAAKSALLGYAASYRDSHAEENFGYLPCPDMTGSGTETVPCGKAGKIVVGLLPYKTLGLPDLRDADGNCLWYAVSGSFKSNPKSAPFNWDTQGQLGVRSAGGASLALPNDALGGAAGVVLAPGAPLAAQRRDSPSNACGAAPSQVDGYLEGDSDIFIDGMRTDASGAVTANDRVAWIAPKEVFDSIAGRSDFAAYMNEGIAAIRSKIANKSPAKGSMLPSTNPFGKQTSSYNFYAGWRDQFRFLRCAVSGCYSDEGGLRYDAVLLFGGRSASGAPRAAESRSLPDYFEGALAMAQGQEPGECSADPPRFDSGSAAARAADIVLCVGP